MLLVLNNWALVSLLFGCFVDVIIVKLPALKQSLDVKNIKFSICKGNFMRSPSRASFAVFEYVEYVYTKEKNYLNISIIAFVQNSCRVAFIRFRLADSSCVSKRTRARTYAVRNLN